MINAQVGSPEIGCLCQAQVNMAVLLEMKKRNLKRQRTAVTKRNKKMKRLLMTPLYKSVCRNYFSIGVNFNWYMIQVYHTPNHRVKKRVYWNLNKLEPGVPYDNLARDISDKKESLCHTLFTIATKTEFHCWRFMFPMAAMNELNTTLSALLYKSQSSIINYIKRKIPELPMLMVWRRIKVVLKSRAVKNKGA